LIVTIHNRYNTATGFWEKNPIFELIENKNIITPLWKLGTQKIIFMLSYLNSINKVVNLSDTTNTNDCNTIWFRGLELIKISVIVIVLLS